MSIWGSKLILHEALKSSIETQKTLHHLILRHEEENKDILNDLDIKDGVIDTMQDTNETLGMAYENASREVAGLKSQNLKLTNENDKLNKSQYKMQGKNQKQGAKVMALEKILRVDNPELWEEYKKDYKNV